MRAISFIRGRRRQLLVIALLLVALWALPPLVPEAWGLDFGPAYRLFFSAFVVAGAFFLELLGTPAAAPLYPVLMIVWFRARTAPNWARRQVERRHAVSAIFRK